VAEEEREHSMDEKRIDSKTSGILDGLVNLSAKLPAPLAYGLGVTVAVVILAVLLRGGVQDSIVALIAVAIVSALVAFVYLDARHRQRLAPLEEVIPKIKGGFARKTFTEPLRECSRQSWIDRYRGACETFILLRLYRDNVEAKGSERQKAVFKQLLEEVDSYREDLAAHLLDEHKFPQAADGILSIPPAVEEPCEKHRKAARDLVDQLRMN
jgi:succinate dehydrogenase flavin-adding protein (antitoxin of CptAB toxin-antitoxin module)